MCTRLWAVSAFGAVLFVIPVGKARTSPLPLDNEALGRLEATLAFCAKIDPSSESKYREKAKLLVKGQSENVVEAARHSKEYKDSVELTNKQLKTVSTADAENACKASLHGK